ncbi:MAG: arylsulfotransferase family protein [Pseudomonadota bacterium]
MQKKHMESLFKLAFILSLVFLSILYGIIAVGLQFFPFPQLEKVWFTWKDLVKKGDFYYLQTTLTSKTAVNFPEKVQPGLTKIVRVAENRTLGIDVINLQGERIHQWTIDWFKIWGDATHLSKEEFPKRRPGTHVHGAAITDDGGVVFNFEHLGLVKLNPCGEVSWRLPFRTHHSVYIDREKNIWVSGQINHDRPLPYLPNYYPPFIEPMILKISPEGKILKAKSVIRLLIDNNLTGMLYLSGRDNFSTLVKHQIPFKRDGGDTLHLNDVEIYEGKPGFFERGDVMISLRNVNAILIFDKDWRLKYQWTNAFVRQHDPDFIDGYTLTVFDNNNVGKKGRGHYSRILRHTVEQDGGGKGKTETVWSGSAYIPFFTGIMGKHQWLDNGNLLLTESQNGRALEIDIRGNPVWEYLNLLGNGKLGIIEEAERLPNNMDKTFFSKAVASCKK